MWSSTSSAPSMSQQLFTEHVLAAAETFFRRWWTPPGVVGAFLRFWRRLRNNSCLRLINMSLWTIPYTAVLTFCGLCSSSPHQPSVRWQSIFCRCSQSLEQSTHRPQDCYLFNGRFQTSLEDLAFHNGLRLTFRLLLLQLFLSRFFIIIIIIFVIIIVVIIAIITFCCYAPSVFTCTVGGAIKITSVTTLRRYTNLFIIIIIII